MPEVHMSLQPAPKPFLTPQDVQRTDGIIFLALVPIEMELYAKTPLACAAILKLLQAEGRTVTAHSRFGFPQWIASLPDEQGMAFYYGSRNGQHDWRTVPQHVLVDEAWHWAPLQPGSDLYATLCRRSHINPDPDYYSQDRQDRREDIHDHNWSRLDALAKHFTVDVDMSEFFEHYRADYPGSSFSVGATFTRAFREFLGGTVVPPRASASSAFLAGMSVVTGMPISDELSQAGIDALGDMPADERKRLAAALRGTTP